MVITIGKFDIAHCYGVARDTEPGPFTDGVEKSFLVLMIATSELWSAIIGQLLLEVGQIQLHLGQHIVHMEMNLMMSDIRFGAEGS